MTEYPMTKMDLEIYLAYIQKQTIHYKTEARGTDCNDWELKRLDQMAVQAMNRFYNPINGDDSPKGNQ